LLIQPAWIDFYMTALRLGVLLGAGLVAASPLLVGSANVSDTRLSEAQIIASARAEVSRRESWPEGAEYYAQHYRGGWRVTAWRIHRPKQTAPSPFVPGQIMPGEYRIIIFDTRGKVTAYLPGE
jgi:hypothetical protein